MRRGSTCLPPCKVADELTVAARELFQAALNALAVDGDFPSLIVNQAGSIALFKVSLCAMALVRRSERDIAALLLSCTQSVEFPVLVKRHYYPSVLLRHNETRTVCR